MPQPGLRSSFYFSAEDERIASHFACAGVFSSSGHTLVEVEVAVHAWPLNPRLQMSQSWGCQGTLEQWLSHGAGSAVPGWDPRAGLSLHPQLGG